MRSSLICILAAFAVVGCTRSFSAPAVRSTALSVDPPSAELAPRGTVSFAIHGGRPPYRLDPQGPQAGTVTLDRGGTVATYQAGQAGSLEDLFAVIDDAGTRVAVRVHIGPTLTLSPAAAAVPIHESQAFLAQGGQAPYRFLLEGNLADGGGSVQAGLFTAGALPASGRVIVLDANDAGAASDVIITAGVAVIPQGARVAPGGQVQLVALGGRPPYAWSAAGNGAHIDPATGLLQIDRSAQPQTLTVTATDSAGQQSTAQVVVLPALQSPSVPPASVVVPGFEFDLIASGGSPPYQFRYASRGNLSGGTLSPAGHYRAGPNGNQLDQLVVEDTTGTAQSIEIQVGTPHLSSSELVTSFSPASGALLISPWMARGELLARSTPLQQPAFGQGLVRYASAGQLLPSPVPPGELLASSDLNDDGAVDLVVADPLSPDHALVYAGSAQGTFTLVGGGGPVPAKLAVLPNFTFGGNILSSRAVLGATVGAGPDYPLDIQTGTVEGLFNGQGLASTGFDAGSARTVYGVASLSASENTVTAALVALIDLPDGGPATEVLQLANVARNILNPTVSVQPPTLQGVVNGGVFGSRPIVAAPLRGDDAKLDLAMIIRAGDIGSGPLFQLVGVIEDPSGPVLVAAPLPGGLGAGGAYSGDSPDQLLVGPSRGGTGSVVVTNLQGDLNELDLLPAVDGGWSWSAPRPLATELAASDRAAVAGTGDLDGDGNLDLAMVDRAGGLTVYFGNAGGGFEGISPVDNRAGTRFRGGDLMRPFQYSRLTVNGGPALLVNDDGALRLLGGSASASGQPRLGLLDQTPPVGFANLIGTMVEANSQRRFILGYDGISRLLAAELLGDQILSPALVTTLDPGDVGPPPRFALVDRDRGGPGSTLAVVRSMALPDGGPSEEVAFIDFSVGPRGLVASAPVNVLTWTPGWWEPITSFALADLDGVPPADLVFALSNSRRASADGGPGTEAFFATTKPTAGGLLGPPVELMVPPEAAEAQVLLDPAGAAVVLVDHSLSPITNLSRATVYPTGPGFQFTAGVNLPLDLTTDGGVTCLVGPLDLLDDPDGGIELAATVLYPRLPLCNSGPRVGNQLPGNVDAVAGSLVTWPLSAPGGSIPLPRETGLSAALEAPNWVLIDANGDGLLDVATQLVSPETHRIGLDPSTLKPSHAGLDLNLWAGLPDGGFTP